MTEHVDVVGAVEHRAHAREAEAAREHRCQTEQLALVVVQQVVRPCHRVAECEVSLRPGRRSPQQSEAIGEPVPYLDRAHGGHARRGQLDSQREPVECLADLGHRGGGVALSQPEVGTHSARSVHEQRDGIGGLASLQRERWHGEHRLAVEHERLACGCEDLDVPRAAEHRGDGRTRSGENVLAVVHHQEETASGQRFGDSVDQRRVAPRRDAQNRRDGCGHRVRVAD